MSFICQECGYKGKQANTGACPACGSHHIRTQASGTLLKEKVDKYRHVKLGVLVVAWSAFGYELVRLIAQ